MFPQNLLCSLCFYTNLISSLNALSDGNHLIFLLPVTDSLLNKRETEKGDQDDKINITGGVQRLDYHLEGVW